MTGNCTTGEQSRAPTVLKCKSWKHLGRGLLQASVTAGSYHLRLRYLHLNSAKEGKESNVKHLSYRALAEVKGGGTKIVSGKGRTVGNWRTVERNIYASWETSQKSLFLKGTPPPKVKKKKTNQTKTTATKTPKKPQNKMPPKKQHYFWKLSLLFYKLSFKK